LEPPPEISITMFFIWPAIIPAALAEPAPAAPGGSLAAVFRTEAP
jgi:hypothetical protein